MQAFEIEKEKVYLLIGLINYVPRSVVRQSIIKRNTGSISIVAADCNRNYSGKIVPYDTFLQLIEGSAEVVINRETKLLGAGQAIVVPAHASNSIRAIQRCKLLATVIKSGYEDEFIEQEELQ